ncbi:hypothetical protein JOQ06_017132 [Pogonophryne albipinna]|uniref:Hypoxia-inducible factor alpha subunit-like domain-containing protein n=1 Tax=Pogonophryne albipinna TaxID=1090488 RepID=A0AAD6FIU8_9TELE|nr:hypothetical protein JOQ06_017132 [Pogonophryne albipinna]
MVMTEEGELIYLTESVSRHIGLTQLLCVTLLMSQHPPFSLIYSSNSQCLRKKPLAEQPSERNFFLRVKSTLTSRGRTVNIKSAAWNVRCYPLYGSPPSAGRGLTSSPAGRVMTLLCEPIPHPSSVEFPLDTCTFLTFHNRQGDRVVLSKGQMSTRHYRFLANGGGFVWAETQATVLYSSRTSLPEAVVCLNFILSGVEQPDVVFSVEQTRCGRLPEAEPQPAEDSGISDLSQSDSGSECLTSTGQFEDAGSIPIPSPVAELFLQVKEELLKEASEAEDTSMGGPHHPADRSAIQTLSVGPGEGETLEEVMDLDMLALYTSMDDDFQLSVLSSVDDKPSSSSKASAGRPADPASRKPTHNPDEELLMIQDKRQKADPSSIEEELLLSHRLLVRQRKCLYSSFSQRR